MTDRIVLFDTRRERVKAHCKARREAYIQAALPELQAATWLRPEARQVSRAMAVLIFSIAYQPGEILRRRRRRKLDSEGFTWEVFNSCEQIGVTSMIVGVLRPYFPQFPPGFLQFAGRMFEVKGELERCSAADVVVFPTSPSHDGDRYAHGSAQPPVRVLQDPERQRLRTETMLADIVATWDGRNQAQRPDYAFQASVEALLHDVRLINVDTGPSAAIAVDLLSSAAERLLHPRVRSPTGFTSERD